MRNLFRLLSILGLAVIAFIMVGCAHCDPASKTCTVQFGGSTPPPEPQKPSGVVSTLPTIEFSKDAWIDVAEGKTPGTLSVLLTTGKTCKGGWKLLQVLPHSTTELISGQAVTIVAESKEFRVLCGDDLITVHVTATHPMTGMVVFSRGKTLTKSLFLHNGAWEKLSP